MKSTGVMWIIVIAALAWLLVSTHHHSNAPAPSPVNVHTLPTPSRSHK